MVAANRCAARFLAMHNASGPFITHPGFRPDRLAELTQFLATHCPEVETPEPRDRDGYRRIMLHLSAPSQSLPLRAMINRFLTRAELSTEPSDHMGMSLECYTNCTSPLRKYVDFLVHAQIKALLHGGSGDLVDAEMLAALAERLANARLASQDAERWLAANYLSRIAREHRETSGEELSFAGHVVHINSSGFTVRLDANGLEGFVDLRQDPEKFSYDKWTSSLTSTTRRFQLEQSVEVLLQGVERENRHRVLLHLVPGCGLKAGSEAGERQPG